MATLPAVQQLRLPTRAIPAVLLALAGLLFLLRLDSGELFRNEGLRALVASETLRTGTWVVPTLHGEPQLTKPPGMTIAIALASLPSGTVTPFSARLPSVVAACLTLVLFYFTFARLPAPHAGFIAAVLVPQSILWLDRVPSAEIDLVQLAWVAGSLLLLLRAVEAAEEGQPLWVQWLWWQSALLCVAGGLLTKWTAPAFFYLTAVPFLAWRRHLRLLLGWPHLLAVFLAALPCVGWLLLAGQAAGWDVLLDTVSREALQRFSPAHHRRPYPWDELATFPVGFLLGTLPGTAVAVLALHPRFGTLLAPQSRRLFHLLHAWIWPSLLFWTLAPGHRPRHVLPLQPALAGLAALVWVAWTAGQLRWPLPGLRPWRALAGLVLVWVAVKLVFAFGVVATRETGKQARLSGEKLAEVVPRGEVIHLCRLKDEGLLFYAHRSTRRVSDPGRVPAGAMAVLTDLEWRTRTNDFEVVKHLHDEQGASIVVARKVEGR